MSNLKSDKATIENAISMLIGRIISVKYDNELVRLDHLGKPVEDVVEFFWPKHSNGDKAVRNEIAKLKLPQGLSAPNSRGRGRGCMTHMLDSVLKAAPQILYFGLRKVTATKEIRETMEKEFGVKAHFDSFATPAVAASQQPVASTAQVISFPPSATVPVAPASAPTPAPVAASVAAPVIESLRNDSIRSQIKDLYPLAEPYIDMLVDEAEKWLGDRVVKRGNARTCSEADFADLVRDYLSKPNLHVKCRDAQAVKLQRVHKTQEAKFNPTGVPIITTGSMKWIAEQDLLDYASFMAQTAADLEREHALARQEIEGLTMVLNARNKTVA